MFETVRLPPAFLIRLGFAEPPSPRGKVLPAISQKVTTVTPVMVAPWKECQDAQKLIKNTKPSPLDLSKMTIDKWLKMCYYL